jgi:hypothetical protein
MTTAVLSPARRNLDRYFFRGMAWLMLGAVLLGFAKTYFLAGMFRAPLPNLLIHLHGAVFTSWFLLLIVQTSLVAAGRVDLHRRLGLFGFGLAVAMVLLGILAATDGLRRGVGDLPEMDAKTFYIIPMTDMVVFGILVFSAFRERLHPPAHKRLILLATIALIIAAVSRWPFAFIQETPYWVTQVCADTFLVPLVAYDLWSCGKLHRATIWGGALIAGVGQARLYLGHTAPWQAFATRALNLARAIQGG